MGGVVHCGYVYNACLAVALLLRQVSLFIERAPIQRSRQGQSVKIFPMYEADERYGCLILLCERWVREKATVVRSLRSRFGKKEVGLLNGKIANTRRYFR